MPKPAGLLGRCSVRHRGTVHDHGGLMKNILAALDSSPGTFDVLTAAIDLATLTGAKIALLRVVTGGGERSVASEALLSTARADLLELARKVPAVRLEGLHATAGVAWEQICAAASTHDTDLVAIGAHRYGPIARALGTTAARVVNHCDRCVLVVRGWRRSPRRILVALDDSEGAVVVRDYAVAFARRAGGKLRILRILDLPAVFPSDMLAQYAAIEGTLGARVAGVLCAEETLIPAELRDGIRAGNAAAAWSPICAAARDYAADLIVVGAPRHGFSDRLLGTSAANVVNHADRSVLVVQVARQVGDVNPGRPPARDRTYAE
jgi:universal stress protein F